jgi:hypothetical protein
MSNFPLFFERESYSTVLLLLEHGLRLWRDEEIEEAEAEKFVYAISPSHAKHVHYPISRNTTHVMKITLYYSD